MPVARPKACAACVRPLNDAGVRAAGEENLARAERFTVFFITVCAGTECLTVRGGRKLHGAHSPA